MDHPIGRLVSRKTEMRSRIICANDYLELTAELTVKEEHVLAVVVLDLQDSENREV